MNTETYRGAAKLAALTVVVATYASLSPPPIWMQPIFVLHQGRFLLAAALFASYAACAVGCIVVPFLKAPAARIPISILMATAVAVDLLFHHLNGNFLRLGMVQTLWSGLPWAGDILPAYRAEILWCVLGAVAFGLILSLRPPAQRALPLRWAAVSCIRIGVNVVFHRDQ